MFAPELGTLDVWLDNVLFQKLEGIILSGPHTGAPVREDDSGDRARGFGPDRRPDR